MFKEIFKYKKIKKTKKRLLEKKWDYDIMELLWDSPIKTKFEENNTCYSLVYRPKLRRRERSIILIPGLRSSVFYEKGMARIFAKSGFDAYIYILPYHLKRTPSGYKNGELYLSSKLELSGDAFFQSITEVMALADITPGREKGLFGISLGGILTHILMGIDDRFTGGVTVSAGGNINRILWTGLLGWVVKREVKRRGATEKDYRETLKKFDDFLRDIRKGNWREPDYPWFLIDPLTYAHLNHPRNVLMFNGLFDPIIPLKSIFELKNDIGTHFFVLLPAGHFSILLFCFYIFLSSIDFFIKWDRAVRK